MNFSGKTAFITGGASGMGLATGRKLLEGGASVTIFDLQQPVDVCALEGHAARIAFVQGDAGCAEDLRAAVRATCDRFGGLDFAVNAAGITGALKPLLDQDDDGMDRLLAVNVRGVFLAMKMEAGAMRARGGGAIVNFASVYSRGAHPNMVLYGATKHAVVGLTEGAAVEWADHGIRVNAVAPGPISTPFIGKITPEIEAAVIHGIPQKRIGRAEEVASVVLWLLSEEGSYVTGATVDIDGGQSARLAG